MNPKVDFYFLKSEKWQKELEQLRKIILDSGLTEELKWGVPCYTFNNKNTVLIHCFKEYCAILFFKGAVLKDDAHILVQQTENVQAARQLRFTKLSEVIKEKANIRAYIYEAIELEKAGVKITLKKTKEYKVPVELERLFKTKPGFKNAFAALTPGRQRGYLLYFSSPVQSKTREARIEKTIAPIMEGKGLND